MSFRPGINSLYPRHLPTHCHLLCFGHCSKQMGWLQPPKSHFCLFCKIYLFLSFSIVTALCPNYSAYTAIHRLHGFIFFTKLHFIPFLWKNINVSPANFQFFCFPFREFDVIMYTERISPHRLCGKAFRIDLLLKRKDFRIRASPRGVPVSSYWMFA